MKVLTIKQPWAWLIVSGHKDIENRTWRTKHRGTLLIHAGKNIDAKAEAYFRQEFLKNGVPFPRNLITGALIGVVTLLDCVNRHPSPWFVGTVGWVLSDPGEFETPMPMNGKQGLWEVPDIPLEYD